MTVSRRAPRGTRRRDRTVGAAPRRRLRTRLAAYLAVATAVGGVAMPALSSTASASTPTVAVVASPNATVGTPAAAAGNTLNGVAAASASSVWAVGSYTDGTYNAGTASAPSVVPMHQTLIEHFDGTSWTLVPSPDQLDVNGAATDNQLLAVSADSATDVWAVGTYADRNAGGYAVPQLLVEHYNGTAWTIAAGPADQLSPRSAENKFLGVDAISPTDVWAVGEYHNGSSPQTLIEQYNGTAWSVVSSPNPSGSTGNVLSSVTTAGTGTLYAAGYWVPTLTPNQEQTLVEQYNGTAWSVVTSPDALNASGVATSNQLNAVSADSATDVWAVGTYAGGTTTAPVNQTLVEQYNGTAWSVVPSPNSGTGVPNMLLSVSADAPTDVWAVGAYSGGTTTAPVDQTLIEHYDGTSWTVVPSPNAGTGVANQLNGAVAVSPTDLWTVGAYTGGTTAAPVSQTLVEGTPPASTVVVTASVPTPVVGQSEVYTATVSGTSTVTATGTVTFTDNGVALPGCTAVPLAAGVATCTAVAGTYTATTPHSIVAAYDGDATHLATTGSLQVTVSPAATTTVLGAPYTSLVVGQPVTLTATVAVTSPGSGTPTGSVTFTNVTTATAPVTLCSAVAVAAGTANDATATCTYTPPATGTVSLEAAYSGSTDQSFAASTSTPLGLTVTTASTTTTVTASANPTPAGQTVDLVATVAPVAPATGTPTGSVDLAALFPPTATDPTPQPVTLCSGAPLYSGVATCLADMPVADAGTVTTAVTATYTGTATFGGSAGTLSEGVQPGALTIQDVQATSYPSNSGVVLSPVTLGSAAANPQAVGVTFGNDQFAQASGTLNNVSVFDGRGTQPGWSVTVQMATDFNNTAPVGPPVDNLIPADFLTLQPLAVVAGPGQAPEQTGVSSGSPSGPGQPFTLSVTQPETLCFAPANSGGGSFSCGASLSLAIPPYVAAGTYSATLVVLTS